MPCYMTGSLEGDLRMSLEEYQEKAGGLTRILCKVCDKATKNGTFKDLPKEARLWYAKHELIDRERKREEARLERERRKKDERELARLKRKLKEV